MDNVIKHLSEEQITKLGKKDKKFLFEIQKEIHDQKVEYYQRLKTYYWVIAIIILINYFFLFTKADNPYFLWEFFGSIIALILLLSGSKIYSINKTYITKKAIAKSKFLDAMEIEAISNQDFKKRLIGLIALIIGGLLYIGIFATIFIEPV